MIELHRASRQGAALTASYGTLGRPADVSGFMDYLVSPEWMAAGVCAQTDPEIFFPEKGGPVREAKRVCGGCPVKGECLAFALDNGERFGVWGGLSERERRRLVRGAA